MNSASSRAQGGQVGPAGLQDVDRRRHVEQGEQQVLDGHEFVALVPRAAERLVETEFQFAAKHVQASSIVHISGC
jgi:hypothetical protein